MLFTSRSRRRKRQALLNFEESNVYAKSMGPLDVWSIGILECEDQHEWCRSLNRGVESSNSFVHVDIF